MLRQSRAAPVVGLRLQLVLIERDDVRVRQQDAVLFDVHRMQAGTDEVMVLQRDRAALLDHDARVAAEGGDPVAELLGVGDRRGERHDAHGRRQVDQDLLPDGASVRVLQVMDLVHHDREQPRERRRAFVEHVAKHLGRHDDDRRLGVDRVVPGQQPHRAGAVLVDEVAELLVRERLQRGRVEGLASTVQGSLDREFRDDGLARAGRRGDEHRPSLVHGVDRIATGSRPARTGTAARNRRGWSRSRPVYGRASGRPARRATEVPTRRRCAARRPAPCRTPRGPRGSRGGRRPRSEGAPRRARDRRCRR